MDLQKNYSPQENESRGIYYMLVSAFVGAIIAAMIKSLSAALSPLIAFWFSRFFPLLGLIPMWIGGKLHHLRTHQLKMHVVFNLLYCSSIAFYFYSLAFLPLVDVSLLFNAAPLYTPLISRLFIKEHFQPRLWKYVIVSFIGVLFVLQPGSSVFHPVSLLAALSGILVAGAQVCNRRLTREEPHTRVVFYMLVFSPVLATLLLLFDPSIFSGISIPKIEHWDILGKLVAAGIGSWLYQLYRAKSVAHARVSIVMPFTFLGVVFVGILDWIFWGTLPNLFSIIGMALIFTGTLFLFRQKAD